MRTEGLLPPPSNICHSKCCKSRQAEYWSHSRKCCWDKIFSVYVIYGTSSPSTTNTDWGCSPVPKQLLGSASLLKELTQVVDCQCRGTFHFLSEWKRRLSQTLSSVPDLLQDVQTWRTSDVSVSLSSQFAVLCLHHSLLRKRKSGWDCNKWIQPKFHRVLLCNFNRSSFLRKVQY